MQYPYAVSFQEAATVRRYVVRANDSGQAVRRASKRYKADPERPVSVQGDLARIMNLTPKQDGGKFLPRIDGNVLPVAPCDDEDSAIAAAVSYVNEESRK